MNREAFYTAIELANNPPQFIEAKPDESFFALWRVARSLFRTIYQCCDCGRLYIEDTHGKYQCFEPREKDTSKEILCTVIDSQSQKEVVENQMIEYWKSRRPITEVELTALALQYRHRDAKATEAANTSLISVPYRVSLSIAGGTLAGVMTTALFGLERGFAETVVFFSTSILFGLVLWTLTGLLKQRSSDSQ